MLKTTVNCIIRLHRYKSEIFRSTGRGGPGNRIQTGRLELIWATRDLFNTAPYPPVIYKANFVDNNTHTIV